MTVDVANYARRRTDWLVVLCFLLSGAAALIYQTAWSRLFAVAFGTSELAIAAVLAAYMGGLAAGSLAAGRLADRILKPVRAYALLEGGIAASAMLVPFLLEAATWSYVKLAGGQPHPPNGGELAQTVFNFAATFAIVGLPTALMGATLPVIARQVVHQNSDIGLRIGFIYGANTAGAVGGVLCGAFLLLPAVGMSGAVWVAVGMNALVFLIAWTLRSYPSEPVTADVSPATAMPQGREWRLTDLSTHPILPIMLASGATTFIYEVLWTRLLGHVVSNSTYGYATMLASFLTGIALGGIAGGALARISARPGWTFAFVQAGIAGSSIATWYLLENTLAGAAARLGPLVVSGSVMLPPAIFIGATYPLAVRICTSQVADVSTQSARVYAWNTVGAIGGAVLASIALLPGIGFAGTIRVAVATNLLLCFATIILIVRPALPLSSLALTLTALSIVLFAPSRPHAVTTQSTMDLVTWPHAPELFYAVGRTSTVLVTETPLGLDFRSNGLPESTIASVDGNRRWDSQRWLGLLPLLARPDSQSMLVVGLGGGVALEGIPPTVREIDVIEIEPAVIAANRAISDRRAYDPLADPRVRLSVNDARNALRLTNKKYDAIVSQPSHPWTAGASHLYTGEFISLVHRHLNEDGVLLMWMNTRFLSPDLLKSLAATVQSHFKYVRVYEVEPEVLHFLASDAPMQLEQPFLTTGRPLLDAADHYKRNGIVDFVDVVAPLLLDENGVRALASGGRLLSDNANRLATHSRPLGDGIGSEQLAGIIGMHDVLSRSNSSVRQLLDRHDLLTIASRLLYAGNEFRVERIIDSLEHPSDQHVVRAMIAEWNGNDALKDRHLRAAYQTEPDNVYAAWLLISDKLDLIAEHRADSLVMDVANQLAGEPASVLRAWKNRKSKDPAVLRQMLASLSGISTGAPWYEESRVLIREMTRDISMP